jgi:four helix bundle protein
MQDYRNLEVWQVSVDYVVRIYKLASSFPHDERHNLAAQMRRIATSIPLNIAAGAGCDSNREFTKYLVYAYSSCNEVVTCLELTSRLCLSNNSDELQDLTIDGNRLC